ncbi:AAA family ATPase [Rhodovulum sulfidophilum]|uniref:AAA family ATPase n=1 Tax=Rhodovulum sulfidophilum TaxID=35806 RepID=UPI003075D92F
MIARRGFHTIPESGRAIIREEVANGGDALPWADRMAYAERMMERDLRANSAAQTLSGPIIFDRGIPDIVGYLNPLRPPRAVTRRCSGQSSPLQRPRLSSAILG